MELVIKIPDEVVERIKSHKYDFWDSEDARNSIRNGIRLPKGHGRLIDADAVLEEPIGDTYKDINIAETIIEAYKEDKR